MDKLRRLTPDVHDLLVYGTRRGRKIGDVCKLAGVGVQTLRTWLAMADQDERAMRLLVESDMIDASRKFGVVSRHCSSPGHPPGRGANLKLSCFRDIAY